MCIVDNDDYEIHVLVREGKYLDEGEYVAIREYVPSDDLYNNRLENFGTIEDAIYQALIWCD